MKSVNIRLNDDESKLLDDLCKQKDKSKSEIMREALILVSQSNNNQNKELQEAESKNKQLAFAIDSLKAILHEKESAKQEQKELYERMLRELNIDKTNIQDLVDQLKSNIQQKQNDVEYLQSKVDEIKKAGIFKRLFLKIA
jgi:hypothetical protein